MDNSGLKMSFKVLSNNGQEKKYFNACFWISIADYLRYVKNYDISITNLFT